MTLEEEEVEEEEELQVLGPAVNEGTFRARPHHNVHRMTLQLSYNVFCLKGEVWESKWEVWRSSWLHRRTLENQERLGQTMHLPWVCHVRAFFRLVAKLLPNCFLLLERCSSQFALSLSLVFSS
jgi:hypothetical protein